MKIDLLNHNLEEFCLKVGMFCGIPSQLIVPNHIGTKFTQKNSIFRSSIWDTEGNLLSASYKKFVNFGENPDNFSVPTSIKNCSIITKIDGSAVIMDCINDCISMRTRGTFSVDTMENVNDFYQCLATYPKITEWLKSHPNYSLITEITTPNLRIVIRYGDEPDFWLTGAVNKDDYSLMTQSDLDILAVELGIKRPERYEFDNIDNMIDVVSKWIGIEGVCLYSPDGQSIWKIKAEDYLTRHRLKEEFGNLEKILDFFIICGCPDYNAFYQKVAEVVDFETAEECRRDISKCVDAYKEVKSIMDGMTRFINDKVMPLGDPKDKKVRGKMAQLVLGAYGNTNRSSFIFKKLDLKELNSEDLIKLFWQTLKK